MNYIYCTYTKRLIKNHRLEMNGSILSSLSDLLKPCQGTFKIQYLIESISLVKANDHLLNLDISYKRPAYAGLFCGYEVTICDLIFLRSQIVTLKKMIFPNWHYREICWLKSIFMDLIIIQQKIYEIRGQKVMLDFDLAQLYEVPTKVLNQAVKRV